MGWFPNAHNQEDGMAEDVMSETTGFHMIYVHPSNNGIHQKADFQHKQIDLRDLVQEQILHVGEQPEQPETQNV